MPEYTNLSCPACHARVGRVQDGKLKIEVRSRLLAVSKSGKAEMNCPRCKAVVYLPLVYAGTDKI